jgi:creatinine amidohydrolase
VGAQDRAFGKRELDGGVGRSPDPLRDGPLGAGVVLRLYGAERAHHLHGAAERRRRQVLMLESQSGDRITLDASHRRLAAGGHVYRSLVLSINLLSVALLGAQSPSPDKLSVHWEELTAADFKDGIARAQGTCLLPFGIMEKHGPHLPLGNDLLNVRYVALNAAEQEYAIVFPEYYFGQIFEAMHEPGTVAYSRGLQLQLLQETTDEMARNGCKKIIIVNGHGGNNSLLPYFAQSQLETRHDYVVYVLGIARSGPGEPKHKSNPATDMHAGESETSMSMIARPDLVHLDRAPQESGADQARLKLPEGLYTGIWWYARFPNHYAGEGAVASRELGEFEAKSWINGIVQAIRAVKADQESLRLQNEFYERSQHPLDTPQ